MTWELALILSAAWWLGPLVAVLRAKLPRPLPTARASGDDTGARPFVSVVVPARNESRNIERCVRSLGQSAYDEFEIVVVDDRSSDDTAELARNVGRGRAKSLLVVAGQALPARWTGKSWACHQGFRRARGDVLLFTDADSCHGPELLGRAVAGMEEDEAHVLSVVGRQEMGSFWERVAQPFMFFLLSQIYPHARRPFRQKRWRWALANGQFLMVRRDAYEAEGGHEAIKEEVVEDLRFAQVMTRAGRTVSIRSDADFSVRMYQSLGELTAGWSKSVETGFRATLGRGPAPFAMAGCATAIVAVWVAPLGVVVVGAATGLGLPVVVCAASAYLAGVVLFSLVARAFQLSAAFGLLHPLSAAVGCWVLIVSGFRGTRVRWKGREYRVPKAA